MAGHTSEKRWSRTSEGDEGIGALVKSEAISIITGLNVAEELYQDLLELWQFAGGTDQEVADLLFKEVYEERKVDGVIATIEVDISGGLVSNPVIIGAGTGYRNGSKFTMPLDTTAGGSGASVKYDIVNGLWTNLVMAAEGIGYIDGAGTSVTDVPSPQEGVSETQANSVEVNMVGDAKAAMAALHDLYGAMTNQVTSTADRIDIMRRMT